MAADDVRRFYDLVADQASILASLIEVRRAKQEQQQASRCGERRNDEGERV
jgi:hypothetical protein